MTGFIESPKYLPNISRGWLTPCHPGPMWIPVGHLLISSGRLALTKKFPTFPTSLDADHWVGPKKSPRDFLPGRKKEDTKKNVTWRTFVNTQNSYFARWTHTQMIMTEYCFFVSFLLGIKPQHVIPSCWNKTISEGYSPLQHHNTLLVIHLQNLWDTGHFPEKLITKWNGMMMIHPKSMAVGYPIFIKGSQLPSFHEGNGRF